MGEELEGGQDRTGTALVEVFPGTAIIFGEVPDGMDLVPFDALPREEVSSLTDAVAKGSAILTVGSQVGSAVAEARGLVQLAPETVAAMKAGARAVQSDGYNIGVLKDAGGLFSAQVRWLPAAEGAQAMASLAVLGPSLTMLAMQVQLGQIDKAVRHTLDLAQATLSAVEQEQWAELTGYEQAIEGAAVEARAVGHVTQGIWGNVEGYEAGIRAQRDLFRRKVQTHAAELEARSGHQERREYMEDHRTGIVQDVRSLLVANKAWIEYQALRAGHVQLTAAGDSSEEKLLQTIVTNARAEYGKTTAQTLKLLDQLDRELHIIAELPGKRAVPLVGGRKDRAAAQRDAAQMMEGIERLLGLLGWETPAKADPDVVFGEEREGVLNDLSILRWQLNVDEQVKAFAAAQDIGGGIGGSIGAGIAAAGIGADDVLIAVTDQRVLVAKQAEFRNHGELRQSVPNEDIRYVRYRTDPSGDRAEVDLITVRENISWRFGKGSGKSVAVQSIAGVLASRMEVPDAERQALTAPIVGADTVAIGTGEE